MQVDVDRIKVLIIDDSPSSRELLTFIIESDSQLMVMACISSGQEALKFLETHKPDVIILDLIMPKMDGYETTQCIMQRYPVPIIIVSGASQVHDVNNIFRALEIGALAVLEKPDGVGSENYSIQVKAITDTIKTVSGAKLISRFIRPNRPSTDLKRTTSFDGACVGVDVDIVAIGASLGGPQALHKIFSEISKDFPAPILVVQHISKGFISGFVEWLSRYSNLKINIAKNGEKAIGGHIYVAPDGFHLEMKQVGIIALTKKNDHEELCPSVARLFRSIANVYGARAVGVILTGMGKDGAEELLLMKKRGALTIAQDEKSSVMFGMPKEAILLNAAKCVVSLEEIAPMLNQIRSM